MAFSHYDKFNNVYDQFYSNSTFEMLNCIKHEFYLLYLRSTQILSHKENRFYNRTDIETNHPYSVHFDIYELYNNQSIPIALGSWNYPVYFDFLPSFRLATILHFPNWLGNSSLDPCIHHTWNQNNSYFCSPYSLCRPDDRSMTTDTKNPFCICPLGCFGSRCYFKFEMCGTYPCLNSGTSIYIYESESEESD